MKNHHTKEQEFLTMSTQELIDYCKKPPKDCEWNELRTATEVLAGRYEACLESMARF